MLEHEQDDAARHFGQFQKARRVSATNRAIGHAVRACEDPNCTREQFLAIAGFMLKQGLYAQMEHTLGLAAARLGDAQEYYELRSRALKEMGFAELSENELNAADHAFE